MSVTEQDRERAIELMAAIQADAQWITSTRREPVDRIAEALADERERARAPFLALLDVSPQLTDEDGTLRGYLVSLPLLSTIGLGEA